MVLMRPCEQPHDFKYRSGNIRYQTERRRGARMLETYYYTMCICPAHSSIVSPSAAGMSSSSSPSIAFLAAFSASSKMSFGTSWCLPLVGPSLELIQDISSSKSLSLLSSCATCMILAASFTPASSDRLPDARSSFSSSAFAACLPFPVAAP